MGQYSVVILSVNDGDWNVWGNRYVSAHMPARQILVAPSVTAERAKASVIEAVNACSGSATLVINVGHGAIVKGGTSSEGFFELAPNGAMIIGGGLIEGRFVDVFYDTQKIPGQPSDLQHDLADNPQSQYLKNWRVYQEIAAAIKGAHLYRVILLTCRIGISIEFLRKVANDWGVIIQAFRKRVAINDIFPNGSPANRPPVKIVGFETELATANSDAGWILFQEEQIPYDPGATVYVGPPL